MARKKLLPIGESGRKWLKDRGLIDDRYSNGLRGFVAKEGSKQNKPKGK